MGLIDVDEAAAILGAHRMWVHHLIDEGILRVAEKAFHRFYLREADVREAGRLRAMLGHWPKSPVLVGVQ
jgi:hypothetical protein